MGVGTELLLGQIANTNARWMSERLAEIGVDVLYHQVVGDNLERIVAVLELALERADVVLVTGGLGPTEDDITRDALAVAAGRADGPSSRDRGVPARAVRGLRRGDDAREQPPAGRRARGRPLRSCRSEGTAPGLIADAPAAATVYAMPGVPGEMVEMMEGTILPELARAARAGRSLRLADAAVHRHRRVARGGARSHDLFEASTNPSVAYLASAGEVKVRLTAKAATTEEAASPDRAARRRGARARWATWSSPSDDETLEEAVGRLLAGGRRRRSRARSRSPAAASAPRLTAVPGRLGVLPWARRSCTRPRRSSGCSGVTRATIDGPGVVSERCAREMAAGARRLFGADVAAVADRGGRARSRTVAREPGTVWLALDAGDVSPRPRLPGRGRARSASAGGPSRRRSTCVRRYLEGCRCPTSDRVI